LGGSVVLGIGCSPTVGGLAEGHNGPDNHVDNLAVVALFALAGWNSTGQGMVPALMFSAQPDDKT